MSRLNLGRRTIFLTAIVVGLGALVGAGGTAAIFSDVQGATGNATAVDKFNKPAPVADAGGTYAVDEGKSVQLDGTNSSKSQGTIKSYSWQIVSGNGTLTSLDTAQPTYHAPADVQSDFDVTVELTVTDNKGNTDSDTGTITVRDTSTTADTPTVDSLTVTTIGNQNRVLDIAADVSDPAGDGDALDTVTIEVVRVKNGQTAHTNTLAVSGASDSVTDSTGQLNKNEDYEVRVTVTDGTGDSGTDSTTATTGS